MKKKKKEEEEDLEKGPVSPRIKAKSCVNRSKLNCMQSLVVPMSVDKGEDPLGSTL